SQRRGAMGKTRVEQVEELAKGRNEPPVPRKFIEEALRRIDAGQEEKRRRYALGMPSPRRTYEIAKRLYEESQKQ
ncbi:hypothetical protein KW798_03445, partial [Candidatus Parcubacteria bacterium]|nr:hypothetical protein [Candidatus Parcubacteria bacterium]